VQLEDAKDRGRWNGIVVAAIDLQQGGPTFCGSRANLYFLKQTGSRQKKKNYILSIYVLFYNFILCAHYYILLVLAILNRIHTVHRVLSRELPSYSYVL
jgi:hypothetical protein